MIEPTTGLIESISDITLTLSGTIGIMETVGTSIDLTIWAGEAIDMATCQDITTQEPMFMFSTMSVIFIRMVRDTKTIIAVAEILQHELTTDPMAMW